jgi:hypothetical protein
MLEVVSFGSQEREWFHSLRTGSGLDAAEVVEAAGDEHGDSQ